MQCLLKCTSRKKVKIDESTLDEIDAERVMNEFGQWGRYQMLGYYLCMVLNIIQSMAMFVMPFVQATPDKECVNATTGETLTSWYVDKEGENKACRLIDPNLIDGTSFACGEQDTRLVTNHTAAVTSMLVEFNYTCSNYLIRESGLTIYTIAAFTCVPTISHFSDVYGRKLMLTVTLVVSLVASFACAAAPYFWTFLVLRFIVGASTDGLATITAILSCEMVVQETRSWVGLVYSFAWVTGYFTVGLISVYPMNWRLFYVLCMTPGLIGLIFIIFINESPHWLAAHKRHKELGEYISNSIAFNGKDVDLSICTISSTRREIRNDQENAEHHYKRALKKPMLYLFIVVNGILQFTIQMYYFALTLTSLSLSRDPFLGYMLSGLIEIPGGIIVIPLMSHFGRRSLTITSLVLQAVFVAGYPYLQQTEHEYLAIACNLVGKLANGVAQVVHPILVSEMFPTKMRTITYAAVNVPQSLGILLSPYVKYATFGYPPLPFLLLAGISTLSACLALILPETKGKKLPEDVDEMDNGPLGQLLKPSKKKNTTSSSTTPPRLGKIKSK